VTFPELDQLEPASANPGAFSPALIGALGMFSSSNIFTDFGCVLRRARSRRANSPSVIGCSGCMTSVVAVPAALACNADEAAGDGSTDDDVFFAAV
jgi:hypothetical protein